MKTTSMKNWVSDMTLNHIPQRCVVFNIHRHTLDHKTSHKNNKLNSNIKRLPQVTITVLGNCLF